MVKRRLLLNYRVQLITGLIQDATRLCFSRQGMRTAGTGCFLWMGLLGVHMQVLAAEAVFFGKRASRKVVAAIVIVCMGVGLSTVTDTQVRAAVH